MVLGHDPFVFKDKIVSQRADDLTLNPAPKLDRIASAVVDLAIVFSFAKVIAARSILALKISINFSLDLSLLANVFNILWIGFSVFLTYKIITYRLFGRSLGQLLFSLKTVSTVKKNLDPFSLVTRSFFAFFSSLFVFPVMSIFLNKDGRSFYDKICDTMVISTKAGVERHNFYFPYDQLLSSFLIFIIFLSASIASLSLTSSSFQFKSDFLDNSKVCTELTSFHTLWSKDGIEDSRLEVALALYSAGELSVECLTKEIDFEMNVNPSSSTAYFAKGLLSLESDSSVIRYFKKSCQLDPTSSSCYVASWISVWPNLIEGEVDVSENEHTPTYLKVWDIKRNHQKGNVQKLAQSLARFNVSKGLEGFYAEHLMRVELHQGHAEKFESVLKITENKNVRSRKLTELFCGAVIGESCESYKSYKLCSDLKIQRSTDNHLKNMVFACEGKSNNIFSGNVKLEDFYKKLSKNEPLILDDLKSIFLNEDNNFEIRFASLNSFFKQVTNIDYLTVFKDEWNSIANKDYFWRITGEKLKNKFNSHGDMQSSFNVYRTLAQEYDEIKMNPNYFEKGLDQNRFPASSKGK